MSDFLMISLAIAFWVFILTWMGRLVYWIWWKPMKMTKYFADQGIKGPPYRLLFGNALEDIKMVNEAYSKPINLSNQIISRVVPFQNHVVKNYGKVSLAWFGPSPRVIIAEAGLVKTILSSKSTQFDQVEVRPMVKFVLTGLVTHVGEKWVTHRRIINPVFHMEKLKAMLPAFSTSCDELISRWEELIDPNKPTEVDVWPEFQNMTGDVISRTAFGSNYGQGRRIFQLQTEQTELLIAGAAKGNIPGYRFLPTQKNFRRREIEREVRGILRKMIEKREKEIKAGAATKNDLLGILMESNFKDAQEQGNKRSVSMTIEDVIDECKLFYFAGQETTSVLLTWTMVLLGIHQDWQARAREEVLQIFGKNKPDFDGLVHAKIVNMILHEVLRLYPPVVSLARRATKTITLNGYTIPTGVEVSLSTIFVHRDPKLWGEDAEEFKPERFSEGVMKASNNQFAFFPFGWGPRICVGQNFALLEAKMALSKILQHYSFELSPSYAHAPVTAITIQPQHGAQVILQRL